MKDRPQERGPAATTPPETPGGARVVTGIAGLDVLLCGGLLRGGIYMVMGLPGTGKTTLGNQLCFARVAGGGRAAYVTLLAESHARMLANLQPFRFFDHAPIGDALVYVGGYIPLRERGLPGLLDLLRRIVRDERLDLLVLDGFATAHAMAETPTALKEFLAELQVLAAMTDCTTVLLANLTSDDARGPEHSMVDGLIELTLQRDRLYTLREVEVLKFRGSDHLLGRHDLEITLGGLVVRPRIEELASRYIAPAGRSLRRLTSGVEGLDAMLGGGYLSGTTTLLLGFSGSGKTMLGAHFLDAGAARGERGLYFGFYESPERLLDGVARVGLGLREHATSGLVDFIWRPSFRYGLDTVADALLENVRRRGVQRLVIDGLDGLRQASPYPERTIRFVTALINTLRTLDVTTLVTEETQKLFGPEVEVRVEGMSALVESIIFLEYLDVGPELRRLLSIIKQRASGYETTLRELNITAQGIELAASSASASKILAHAFGSTRVRRERPSGPRVRKSRARRPREK